MKFNCEKCGKIDEAILDEIAPYLSWDSKEASPRFRIRKNDDGTVVLTPHEDWYKLLKELAEKQDIFTCPTCDGQIIPDDMLADTDPTKGGNMTKPSQLKENQCIRLVDSGGCIEFHRYYGELATVAKNGNSIPMDGSGIEITTDEKLADEIFTSWYERIENIKMEKYPQAWHTRRISKLKIEYLMV